MAVPGNKKEIDYLKAFSIILVVLYHVIVSSGIYWNNLFYISLCIALQNVHVPLFILLAGYLCHKQDVGRFFRKKVRRILIPFLFMTCLKLLFNNFISAEFLHAGSFPMQLYDAFVCGNLYWFSYCLLVLFLLAPLLWNHRLRIWILLVLSMAANILIRLYQWDLPDIFQLSKVVQMLPFFLTGMLAAEYRAFDTLKKTGVRLTGAVVSLVIAGVCGYFRFHNDVNNSWYLDFLMGLCLMFLLSILAGGLAGFLAKREAGSGSESFSAHLRSGSDRVLTVLGKYSYQIMLLDAFYHWAFFRLLEGVLPVGILLILFVTFLTLLFSGLTCLALKRIPGLSFLTGVKDII